MIRSYLVAPREGVEVAYLLFDTAIENKHVFVACGVGRIKGRDAHLTETAQATLHSLIAYANDDSAAITLAEIATVAAASVRVRKALDAADEKSVVFFVCRSPEVYDAAVEALGVVWKTEGDTQ